MHGAAVVLALASVVLTSCVNHRNWDLSPTYDTAPIPGPTIVMPVQMCGGDTHGAKVNVNQRQLANRVWPEALWKGLHLPGEARTERREKANWFCDFASYQRDTSTATAFQLNAIQRDEVAKVLAAHPGARTVVIPYFSNLMTGSEVTRRLTDTAGQTLVVQHTGVEKHTDEGSVVFGVFAFTATDIAYMTASVCGGVANPAECYGIAVDENYTQANEAVIKRLRSFPWRILGLQASPSWEGLGLVDASLLVEVQAAPSAAIDELAPTATPAAKPAPVGSRHGEPVTRKRAN